MNRDDVSVGAPIATGVAHGTRDPVRSVQVRGGWLLFARLFWVTVTLLSVLQFGVVLPSVFVRYQKVCPQHCVLTLATTRELGAWGVSPAFYASYNLVLISIVMGICCLIGTLIFWRTKGKSSVDCMALLASLMLAMTGLSLILNASFQQLTQRLDTFSFLARSLLTLSQALLVLFLYLFPDGRFVPGWMVVPATLLIMCLLGANFFLYGTHLWEKRLPVHLLTLALLMMSVVTVCALALSVGSQAYKYHQFSTREQRQQTRWVAFGIVAIFLAFIMQQFFTWILPSTALNVLLYPAIAACAYLCLPLSLSFTFLRYQLWDVTLLINRALVYSVLTAIAMGSYVLVVGGLGTLLQTPGNPLISLLAIGMIALLIHPVRLRLQRAINHLLYGARDDPYAVLSRLGQRLEMTLEAQAMLPTIVEVLVQTFQVPYAAIALRQGKQVTIEAAYGHPGQEVLRFLLRYREETVGELLLAPRSPGEPLTAADKRLLIDLERQAGAAVHAVLQARALQYSRERLVTAREEERRRIRRDLHDGLGPVLGSQTLKLDAVRHLLKQDPVRAEALLIELKQQTQQALADIRRLVYDLRPPTLDELGLVSALHELARRYQPGNLVLTFQIAEPLPSLSAALEVAIYRIAQEALANVVQHARASSCLVSLTCDDVLTLEICDDGCGLPEQRRTGLGLSSMRERAAELGGTWTIEARATGGTCVRGRLPFMKEKAL